MSTLDWVWNMGFRWVTEWRSHRDDGVDPHQPVLEEDAAYDAKFDWLAAPKPLTRPDVPDTWQPVGVDIVTALATPGGVGPSTSLTPVAGGWLPCSWFCGGGPTRPGTEQPGGPDIIVQPAPVPLMASDVFLVLGLAALAVTRYYKNRRVRWAAC